MENNLITHLETIITLIIIIVVFIVNPYLVGLLLDKLINITRTDRDHVVIWFFGAMILITIGILVLGTCCVYRDIFNYYTKH